MSDLLQKYASVAEYLDGLSVYEVRNIARELGVRSPTTEKKGELIEQIVMVAAGLVSPLGKMTNKGAPPKAAKVSENILSEILTHERDIAESGRQIEQQASLLSGAFLDTQITHSYMSVPNTSSTVDDDDSPTASVISAISASMSSIL